MIKVKKLDSNAVLPQYAHPGDAGMDFYANEEIVVKGGERSLVHTGISVAIPEGYVGLFWEKSGLAMNHGIRTMAGVIDAGYRGEIKILLRNTSSDDFKVEKGMKIAQLLIQPVESKRVVEVEELDETARGEGGFGSTGLRD